MKIYWEVKNMDHFQIIEAIVACQPFHKIILTIHEDMLHTNVMEMMLYIGYCDGKIMKILVGQIVQWQQIDTSRNILYVMNIYLWLRKVGNERLLSLTHV